MYMHVSCLSLIFACFQYAQAKTPIDFYNCVRVCVKMMTSEACGIEFH